MARPTVTVVIPSYGRPEGLAACLDGIAVQTLAPESIVVVVRPDDAATAQLVSDRATAGTPIRTAMVREPGLIAALNRGVVAAVTDVVAFVDDDAVPRRDWLERIVATYAGDTRISAVGGRDIVHLGDSIDDVPRGLRARVPGRSRAPIVGRLSWYGYLSGNHHLGHGPARDVDLLKGANMSYRRRDALEIGFDTRLAGRGSQVHNEASLCLPLRRRGLRIVYDPSIAVDHHVRPRAAGDERERVDRRAIRDRAFNYSLSIFDHLQPLERLAFFGWAVVIGTRITPGIANFLRLVLRGEGADAAHRLLSAQAGLWAGWRAHRHVRRPEASAR